MLNLAGRRGIAAGPGFHGIFPGFRLASESGQTAIAAISPTSGLFRIFGVVAARPSF
jgi:hypothetical protein